MSDAVSCGPYWGHAISNDEAISPPALRVDPPTEHTRVVTLQPRERIQIVDQAGCPLAEIIASERGPFVRFSPQANAARD